MNFGDRSKLACVAHPRLPSSKFDHVALGQILGDAWSCSCVLAATSSELHLFRVNLSRHAGGEGSLVPLCRVSVFAQISGIACIPHPTSKPQGSPRADNFIVLLRNGFLGLYQYDCRCNRLQACCWTPTISGLEEHDYAVCLAINATGKVAVVSKYGQVFAAELGVPLGSQPKSLALNNSVEFSALIMTRELDFMSSTQMFSKYYSVKCARWGEYTLCAGSVGDKPRSGVEALWIHGTCDVDQTEAYLTCSYFPFWYLEAPRALSIEVMLGFAFPLPPPFQNKLVFADSSNRLRLGEPSMSRRIEVEDLQNDLPSSSGAGKWILESTTTGQLVSFHGQLFRDESTLIDATVGTPEGAGGFQSDAPLMMVTSDGELFVGDVMNCEMHCCKSPFEMNFANVTSVLPLTDDLSALICLIDSGEVQLLTREDGDVDMSVAAEGQAAQLQKGVRSYSVMWASQFGVGKLIDATAIQRRNSVTMLTIHEGVNDSFQQESLEDKGACGKPSLLTWAPDPVPDVLFEGMAGEAENITSMWALQNDRGHDAAIILSSSSGTRVLEADITGIFVDVTDDIVELDCAAETLAAGNIQTNNATGWAAQVTAKAVIGFKPFDRSKVTGNKWLIPENFHVGAATVTGGMVVMHVLIHGYNHLLLLRMSVSISMESGSIGDNAEQGSHASWIVMCDMALDDEASCISNAVATGCHFFLAIGTYKPSILLIKANCDSSSCSADLIDEFLCSNTKTDDQLATLGPKGSAIMSTGRQSSDGKEDKDLVLEIPAAIILQPSPPRADLMVEGCGKKDWIDVWTTLRNGVFQNMRCSIEELPGGAVAWSPVYIISDSGSVPPSLFPLPQYTPSGTCFSVMSITTDTAMLCRTLEDSAGIDCSYLRLPFPMLNAALPLGLSSNDSRVNCFLTCRQDGALCLLSLEPSGQTHVISKSCPLPYPSIPTGLFTSRFFDEFSHIVCIAGYEVAQDGKYLPVLALYNTILQEIMTSLESAEKFPTLGYWTLGSFLPFFSHLTVTAVEFLPTAAVEVNRRIIRASSNVASSGYLLVVLSDPGGLRWLSRKFKDQELGWLLVFRFQNCVPYVSISHPSSLELCGIQRFTDPITSICVAHPDMWVTSSSGLSQFKKPLIFVAVASRLVAYEVEYDSSKAPHDQIKFTLKTWYRTVEVVTSLSPLPDAILAGSLAGVVAYGFDYIERGTDSNNSRESRYHITLKRYSATSQQLKEVSSVVPTGPGEGVFMGLEIDKTGRVSFFKWKNSGESLMKPLMPQIRVGEASLGMKSLPVGLLSQAQYLFTRHQGMWRFEMRNLDAETLEAILAIQKEASSHWAVGGCCYDDFRFGGNGTGYVNPPPDLCDETAASVEGPAAIVISQSMGTEEQDEKKDPECSSPIDDNGVDNGADGAAFLDGELLRKFVNAPLTVQKEILFGAGLLQGRNTNDRGGGLDELYKITTLVICVWQCIRS